MSFGQKRNPTPNASQSQHQTNSNGQIPDWLRCCNRCVQGRVSLITNCGHLLCPNCFDNANNKCCICGKSCSVIELKPGFNGIPDEVKMLLQPVEIYIKNSQMKITQIAEFQKSHQNRLISNLKLKMKKMNDKMSTTVKSQENEISSLKSEILQLRKINSQMQHGQNRAINSPQNYSSHQQDNMWKNSGQSMQNLQQVHENHHSDFLSNFTPLKNDTSKNSPNIYQNQHQTPSKFMYNSNNLTAMSQNTNNNYNSIPSSSQLPQPIHSGHNISPKSSNSMNPNLRMSMRTPQSQQKLNNSLTRTPSPYSLNTSQGNLAGTPSPTNRSLNLSSGSESFRSSTPNLVNLHTSLKSSQVLNNPSNENRPSPHQQRPYTPNSGNSSLESLSSSAEDMQTKASNALMRLSQSLAFKSMQNK